MKHHKGKPVRKVVKSEQSLTTAKLCNDEFASEGQKNWGKEIATNLMALLEAAKRIN